MRKKLALIVAGIILVVGGASFALFARKTPNSIQQHPAATSTQAVENSSITQSQSNHGPCLADNEYADYPKKYSNPGLTEPASVPFDVVVYNSAREKKMQFEITDLIRNNGYPLELHRCGLYVIKQFNFDWNKLEALSGFREAIWKYAYDGTSNELIVLAKKNDSSKEPSFYFSPEFRIDREETHIALTRGYLGSSDYAIIIKNLDTLQDVLVLPIQDIEKRNPDLVQDISFENGGWTDDDRYFWADTHNGANTLGFIRIDMQTKTFDLFPAPKDMLGGDAVNVERGLVTVYPGNVWYGIAQVEDEEKARLRAQGIGTELYIYNLFTKQQQFVASTTEPLYYFQPRWLSSTTLQYTLPSGATTTYTIPQ